jgi:hypothetical protein
MSDFLHFFKSNSAITLSLCTIPLHVNWGIYNYLKTISWQVILSIYVFFIKSVFQMITLPLDINQSFRIHHLHVMYFLPLKEEKTRKIYMFRNSFNRGKKTTSSFFHIKRFLKCEHKLFWYINIILIHLFEMFLL